MTVPAKAWITAVGKHLREFGDVGAAEHATDTFTQAVAETSAEIQADEPAIGVVEIVAFADVGHPASLRTGGDDVELGVDDDAQQHVVDRVTGCAHLAGQQRLARLGVGERGIRFPQAIVAQEHLHIDLAAVLELARSRRRRKSHRSRTQCQGERA